MREDLGNFFPWFLAIAGFTAFAICATADRAATHTDPEDVLIEPVSSQTITSPRPEEAVYRIGPTLYDLTDGASGKVSVVSVPFRADLDRNGTEDALVVLRNDTDSESLYYIGGAMRRGDQFEGSDMYLIGDRIALGRSTFENGLVVQDFTDRNGKEETLYLKIVDGTVIDGRERPPSDPSTLD